MAIAIDEEVSQEDLIAATSDKAEDIDAAELEFKKSDKIAKHFTKEINRAKYRIQWDSPRSPPARHSAGAAGRQ